jgi:hypothetical protein
MTTTKKRHRFTDEEAALVRQLYDTHTAAEIAQRIHGTGRAARSIFQFACRLGLRKWPCHSPETLDRVRELHGQGLNDTQIAAAMGMNKRNVSEIRLNRLKLPKNVEAIRAARRRAVRTQQATLGIDSGGELRAIAYRKFAAENGWPETLRPREVQILNVLAASGVPMSRLEIAEKIGMRTDRMGGNKTLALLVGNGPGGTYTASLLRLGMIDVLKRADKSKGGKGCSRHLYVLGPAALAILEERACQAATEAGTGAVEAP